MTPSVVIVGLGVSGLACALELTRLGVPFFALEKESRPGGLARSDVVDGFRFDCGPHILLGVPPELRALVTELPGLHLKACAGRSYVALGTDMECLVPAPFQQHLNRLPARLRSRVLVDLARRRRRAPSTASSYGEFVKALCGKTIFDAFLGAYDSKRLKFSLDDMPPDWTTRVVKPSLRSLLRPRRAARSGGERSPEERFYYPSTGGIERLPQAMASLLAPERILCGRDIVGIDPASRTVTDARGETMAYERLVLSLPLPTIVSLLVDPPATLIEAAQNLVYTSIYVINVGVEGPPPPWTLLRFPADHVGFYRLSVPSAYAPESAPDGHVALVAEISHHPTRYPVTPGEALEDVRTGLARLGVVPRAERVVVERLTDIRFGHVVWSHRTGASVRLILDYLNSQSIYTCGKYGLWRDMLMTHSMISGIEVARRIDGSRRGASVPAEPLAV